MAPAVTGPRRLLMIGLDAFDRSILNAYPDDMPHIARLLREGRGGELESDPLAGSVWPSFYTRSRPADHAVFHHLQWDPNRMRMRRSDRGWLPMRPFWRDLGEQGRRVIAFDIPFVFPGPAPNCLEVMNWGSHDLAGPYWASDKRVERRIRREFGLHPMGFEVPVRKSRAHLEKLLDEMIRGAALKGRVAAALMREEPWDLFVIAFGEPHRGGHTIWANPEQDGDPAPPDGIRRIYKAVDEAVGALVAEAGDVDVIVFALHSMAPNSSQSHMTSTFMQRAIARFRGEAAPAEKGDAPGLMRTLRRAVPAGLQFAIAAAVPLAVRDFVVTREIHGGYRWGETGGLCLHGDLAGYLRLNIKGREREGILTDEEALALEAFIGAELETLTVPGGRKLVRRVSYPARAGGGARAHLLPDILVEWDPDILPAPEVHSPTLGVIRVAPATGRGGNHRFDAFYAYVGDRDPGPAPRHISELGGMAAGLL